MHLDLTERATSQTRRQLGLGRKAIEAASGQRPRWFRPPRGNLTGAAICAAAELGQDLLWSVDRGSGGVAMPAAVADRLARAVGPGDVVGLHDGIGRGSFDPGGALARRLRARRLARAYTDADSSIPTAVPRAAGAADRRVPIDRLATTPASAYDRAHVIPGLVAAG